MKAERSGQQEGEGEQGDISEDISQLRKRLFDIGLGGRCAVYPATTRDKGLPAVSLHMGIRSIKITPGAGLEQLVAGDAKMLLKFLEGLCPGGGPVSASTGDLLRRRAFAGSCVDAVPTVYPNGHPMIGNTLLTSAFGLPKDVVPCLYGSTGGLNFAELLETRVCTRAVAQRGVRAHTVFDMVGGDSAKATANLRVCIGALPGPMQSRAVDFVRLLGETGSTQIATAVRILTEDADDFTLVPGERLIQKMGKSFTLGKLMLLARLSQTDPVIHKGIKVSHLLARVSAEDLTRPVADFLDLSRPDEIGGMVYYARETVMAGDVKGSLALPLKLTNRANIYKILERYQALAAQNADMGLSGGAILCPIRRHRIQFGRQAIQGGDPCDVRVLAYLAQVQPANFAHLVSDFQTSCKVLTPSEAVETGSDDVKFIVERYFRL
jgi:hypothetical protein